MTPMIAAVDFFCGCGGMTRGMLDSGIHVVAGVDIDPDVRETYENNNRPSVLVECDIRNFHKEDLDKVVDRSKWDFLVLAACAPCQPFSRLAREPRRDGTESLLWEFARVVEETEPDAIIVENVPGLKGGEGKRRWTRFVNRIGRMRYIPDDDILNANGFGVPQNRKRLALVAGKEFAVTLPSPTHGPPGTLLRRFLTVKDAIGGYPPIRAGGTSRKVPNHTARKLSALNLKRIRLVPQDGGSRTSLPSRYVLECHKDHSGHSDTYGRMAWDEPAPTLTCKCTSITNGRYGHPTQDRGISVREAAALQTFPPTFVFPDEIGLATAMIGNAVPVELAKALSQSVVEALTQVAARKAIQKLPMEARSVRA